MGNIVAFSEIGSIKITSSSWKGELTEKVAGVTVDFSTEISSEINLSISDPAFTLLRSKKIPIGALVSFQNEKFVVSAVQLDTGVAGTGALIVTCRSRIVHRLKKRKGKHKRTGISPTTYIKSEVEAVGGKFVGQTTSRRKSITRDVVEKDNKSSKNNSAWTTFQRLAEEEGFYVFESEGTVYFGKPTWLVKRGQKHVARYSVSSSATDAETLQTAPSCRKSADDGNNISGTFTFPVSRFNKMQVGEVIQLKDMGMFTASYLITGKTYENGSDTFEVEAETPEDPEKPKES